MHATLPELVRTALDENQSPQEIEALALTVSSPAFYVSVATLSQRVALAVQEHLDAICALGSPSDIGSTTHYVLKCSLTERFERIVKRLCS